MQMDGCADREANMMNLMVFFFLQLFGKFDKGGSFLKKCIT